jgi:predicted nucleic acid-binding Zn ribbon protein
MTFKRIGSGLTGMIARWIDDPQLREQLVQHAWARACGEAIARHTRVLGLDDEGVLRVRVDEAQWMPTLRQIHVELVDKVRDELGREAVRRLEWVQADVTEDRGGRRTDG